MNPLDKSSIFEKIESNVMSLQEWEGPELKIKFKTMEEYLQFLEKTEIKPSYFEPMHLINLKSRYELSKAPDPRMEIFKRIEKGLKERGYKEELTLNSDIGKIAESLWGKNSVRGYLNMYLPDIIGIWNSDISNKDPSTIESAVEIAMDKLVDYKIFHSFKDFQWDVDHPVEFLHYLISHLYLSLAGRIKRIENHKFSLKLFKIDTSGFPKIDADKLDIELEMIPSYASEEFYFYNIHTVKDGFKYSINAVIPKDLNAPEEAIIIRSEKTAINLADRNLNRSRYFKLHADEGYNEIVEKIVKIQKKIELYFRCLTPDIFEDD